MKPRNKYEKRVTELSASLPPVTQEQLQWAYDKCFNPRAVLSRKTISCLECGHSERSELQAWQEQIVGHTCSNCGRTMKVHPHTRTYYENREYAAVLTTKKEFQVVRIIQVLKHEKRNKPAVYFGGEVTQHWIDASGKWTILGKLVHQSQQYYDSWNFSSELSIKDVHHRFMIAPYKVHPKRKVLPMLKRNGFKGRFYGIHAGKLFPHILTDQITETLLKAGQINLLSKHLGYSVHRYWPSIKICIRNGYIVKDAGIWTDYIDLLNYFRKDVYSPKYVCPVDLRKAHDRLVEKKREIQRRQKLEEQRKSIEKAQRRFAKHIAPFLGLTFTDGHITIKPLETIQEFMEEGDKLKHCVFANEYYKKKHMLILSARINGEPVETIEVSLSALEIVQSRGMNNNASEYNARIVDLVNKNMHLIEQIVAPKKMSA